MTAVWDRIYQLVFAGIGIGALLLLWRIAGRVAKWEVWIEAADKHMESADTQIQELKTISATMTAAVTSLTSRLTEAIERRKRA